MEIVLSGTQTEKNLLKAFAGESQAKNRYTYYAEIASEEGFEQIADLFIETAFQEEQHAKVFFSFLEGGMVEITASYPAGELSTTEENLKAAANGEHEEWTSLYPHFAEVAEKEGFKKIATAFKLIAKIEAEHEARYRKLLERVEADKVFEREEAIDWVCTICGHLHHGKKALKNCPVCGNSEAYFEEKAINY